MFSSAGEDGLTVSFSQDLVVGWAFGEVVVSRVFVAVPGLLTVAAVERSTLFACMGCHLGIVKTIPAWSNTGGG